MSKISTYNLADTPLQLSDRLIGTEAPRPTPTATPLATKNFSLGELLQLFSSNFPAASLQAVLDTNNTATEDINLTGTINTTLIKPSNIIDMLNSQGTPLQILSKGVGGICWIDGPNLSGYVPTSRELTINGVTYDLSANRSWTIGTGVQNLQEVTDEGNETTNPLIVISNNGFDENKAYIGPTFIEVSNKDIALNETTRVTLENSGIRRYNIVDGGYMLDLTDASNAVPSTETRLLKAPILTADAIIATEEWVVNNVPTLQEVTDEGATTTNSISVTDVANNKIAGINANVISVSDTITSENTAMQSEGIVFINPGASAGVLLKAATQTGNVGELLIPDVGLTPKTIAFTSDIGTWGALDYPAWTTGTPFVKMTAAGTFALDTNTYLTSADLTGFVPYTGATQNVNLGEFELKAGQLTLDISPTGTAAVGTTRWNNSIGTSETTLKGGSVILKNGVDLVARVVNKVTPNTTLTKANYAAVRISGAQGQRLAVAYAQANNDNNSADTIGLVTETIPTNQEGFILTVGQLEDINTTGSLQGETWNDGDVLYLSPTIPGSLTNIKPSAPGHIVVIGYVEYAHNNNGKIYVKIMNGWELDELHNVAISTPLNNQALVYETSTQLWKNKTIIQDSITDGVTEISPSQNAVFDALATKENSLGFTPENVTNKSTTLDADKLSNVKYPSVKSVFDWAVGLFTQSYIIQRLTTVQRDAIVSPSVGLQIFNTTAGYLEYYDSFWGWMPIANQNEWKRKFGTEYFNDFGNNNTFSDGVFQTFPLNGGGTLTFNPLPNTNNYIGYQGLVTGVNTNGGNGIRTDLNTGRFFVFNCGRKSFISRIWVLALSTITDRYTILNGFSNSANTTITSGAAFIYDEGGVGTGTTASPNWQIITANGGVRTNFVTSVPVNITTWYSFKIETNENDTEVYYYINDVLVRTETTNIPAGGVSLIQPYITINKNTGTTNRGIAVDYLGLKIKLNNAR